MSNKNGMLIVSLLVCILIFGGLSLVIGTQEIAKLEVGTRANDTKEMIEKRKKQKVEKSILAARMEQVIEFADGKSEGTLNIENQPENNYEIMVEITDKNQEVLYRSLTIEPGMIIRRDKLKVELEKGKHLCTATFKAYDETGKEVNKANAQIVIQVRQ